MRSLILALVTPVLVLACTSSTPPPAATATAASSTTAKVANANTPASFGAPISESTPFVALAEVLKSPEKFDGKQIRTRGEVVAVCQNAGCWCDLRDPAASPDAPALPVHVTMHGHAFFLPKDSKNKLADLEGTIAVRTLTQDECDHFNSEGAKLVAGTPVVGVDALGVALTN